MRLIVIFVLGISFGFSCSAPRAPEAISGANHLLVNPGATPPPEKEETVPFDVVAERLKLPKPADFPVPKREMFIGTPAAAKIVGKRAATYKTVISEGAKRGPNFAGHYTVVTWGAGMGNFSLAVVDARDGHIIFMPFDGVGHAGYGLNFETGEETNPAYRVDSKLIAFSGCPSKEYTGCTDWDKEGFYLYSFENERFKLRKFVKQSDFEAALKK